MNAIIYGSAASIDVFFNERKKSAIEHSGKHFSRGDSPGFYAFGQHTCVKLD